MFTFSNNSLPPTHPPDPSKLTLRPTESLTYMLPSGRVLGYATYGSTSPSAPVIFLFHGMPGSRIVGRGFDVACQNVGARLITIDRPGCSLSSYAVRKLVDWPEDVIALADHLNIEKFSIVGASGGGPYALACARFIPAERLRGTTVVCGIGSLESIMDTVPWLSWRLWGLTPWLLRLATRWIVIPLLMRPYVGKDAAGIKRVIEDQCTTAEEKALLEHDGEDGTNVDDSVVQILEAFKQGKRGFVLDGTVLVQDWGFKLENVDAKRVWLVHGDQDTHAPVAWAKWIDEKLGGGRLRVLEGKTHFTIWKDHAGEIFRQSAEA